MKLFSCEVIMLPQETSGIDLSRRNEVYLKMIFYIANVDTQLMSRNSLILNINLWLVDVKELIPELTARKHFKLESQNIQKIY